MRKIISAVSASAESTRTMPSGIAYDDIGISINSDIKERESGLASCAVSVFDRDGKVYVYQRWHLS